MTTASGSLLRTVRSLLVSAVAPRAGRRAWVLIAGLLAIGAWQATFRGPDARIDATYRLTASTGISLEQRFFFFLRHLDLYPLATTSPIRVDSKDEAERLLRSSPGDLRMDEGVTFRSGDRGRAYLYFVDAWRGGSSVTPSLKPAHALAFLTALELLFVAFWWIRRPIFGAGLVLLLGSNPFQLHAVYAEENIFSWSITTLILVLAVHVPILGSKPQRGPYPWVAAVVTGIAVATIRTVRSEPVPVLAGAMLAYAFLAGAARWKRLALVAVLVATFASTNALHAKLIERKFERTAAIVREVGGVPYEGPLTLYHEFWHAIFCGLGDYDTKYGYAWDDRVAYRFALPRLEALHGRALGLDTRFGGQRRSYDGEGTYPVFFSETPGYHEIMRDKVLGDIRRDPAWYAWILRKRVWRILTDTSPVSISLSDVQYETKGPLIGLACVPLLAFLIVTRRVLFAKLLVMSATTSTSALLIFSDRGMTYYGCFHLVGTAIFGALLFEGAEVWLERRGRSV